MACAAFLMTGRLPTGTERARGPPEPAKVAA
jgi:hypothetical protein